MARFTSRLDNVRIASPCPANWDSMCGNERIRFCGECQLNVYNISEMSKAEAEQLIGQAEGRLCVRYYRRKDGSIITQNCPVGLRALKRRVSRIAAAISSVIFAFLTGVGAHSLAGKLYPVGERLLMGDIATTGVMVPRENLPLISTGPAEPPVLQVQLGKMVPIPPNKIKRK